MKATFEIPDELYRSAKARSALEGRPLRQVVIELFQQWLASSTARREPTTDEPLTEAEMEQYPWLAITQPLVRSEMNHALNDIKKAAARGWAEDLAQRFQKDRSVNVTKFVLRNRA